MSRLYYVSWLQSHNHAAGLCHAVVRAESEEQARRDWRTLCGACPARGPDPEELVEVDEELAGAPRGDILEYHAGPPAPCEHLVGRGATQRCRHATTTGCREGRLPRGCSERAYQDWWRRWGHTCAVIEGRRAAERARRRPAGRLAALLGRWL